jgi:hypothetical protein
VLIKQDNEKKNEEICKSMHIKDGKTKLYRMT